VSLQLLCAQKCSLGWEKKNGWRPFINGNTSLSHRWWWRQEHLVAKRN
jgi:hypothetical protein